VGLLLGLLFQRTARRALATGHTLAAAYAVESAGALAGGLATLAWAHAEYPTLGLALAGPAACALACLAASRRVSTTMRAATASVVLASLAALTQAGALDDAMTRWNHPQLVSTHDSPYGRITMTGSGDQVAVFENDALSFQTGGADAELLAHLAALSHPAPARMLLLGGGPEGLGRELLQHRPSALDIVELNAALLEMTAEIGLETLPRRDRPGVRLVVADPRPYLRGAGRHDVIVVGAHDPDSGQANRFYTSQFFAACASRLEEDGVVAFRLRTAENVWTPAQALRFASVHAAVRTAFAHVVVLPGATTVVLASQAALPQNAEPLVRRHGERELRTALVGPAYLRYLFANDRRAAIDEVVGRTRVPVNTDAYPVCYRYALVLWIGRFWPALAGVDPRAPMAMRAASLAIGVALSAVAALLWWARRRSARQGAVYVAFIAAAGLLIESVVLMHYQVTRGVVFQDIGLLVAAFMAGLSVGTWVASRVPRRPGSPRAAGMAIAAVMLVAGPVAAAAVEAGVAMTLAAAVTALSVTGGIVGAAFGWASLRDATRQRAAIGPLYAADLVGGSVGAVLGGLILIPAAGLAVTALVAGAFALVAAWLA
jgi:spermidine synthase